MPAVKETQAPQGADSRPIFASTLPRSCSTAFERVFLTRKDLNCVHEPYGEAFYFGPENLSDRYSEKERKESEYSGTTYGDVTKHLLEAHGQDGKRLFVKDIAYYMVPPLGKPTGLAPSLSKNLPAEPDNPTAIPYEILSKFSYIFLIRNPRQAVPSFYRCTVPPLSKLTGFNNYDPAESGYRELRLVFDFFKKKGLFEEQGVCLIDAEDLLTKPKETIRAVCEHVGLEYSDDMLEWDARDGIEAFDKWKGFHEDALGSTGLRASEKRPQKPEEEDYKAWVEKFGEEAAKVIRQTARDNMADYEYLKKFKINV